MPVDMIGQHISVGDICIWKKAGDAIPVVWTGNRFHSISPHGTSLSPKRHSSLISRRTIKVPRLSILNTSQQLLFTKCGHYSQLAKLTAFREMAQQYQPTPLSTINEMVAVQPMTATAPQVIFLGTAQPIDKDKQKEDQEIDRLLAEARAKANKEAEERAKPSPFDILE